MGKITTGGFTLIEIVVVAGVMSLFSITLIGVFLATLRGETKSQVTQLVHQEGDLVIKQMSRTIREAETVVCNGSQATVTMPAGNTIRYSLVNDDGVVRVASDSSNFLSGKAAEATVLSFICDPSFIGNQVVTIRLELSQNPTGQIQEKSVQSFATSISTRQH